MVIQRSRFFPLRSPDVHGSRSAHDMRRVSRLEHPHYAYGFPIELAHLGDVWRNRINLLSEELPKVGLKVGSSWAGPANRVAVVGYSEQYPAAESVGKGCRRSPEFWRLGRLYLALD